MNKNGMLDIWRRSYTKPPASVVLDIDDTLDVVLGRQKLAEWNAHYERRFPPIHIYDASTGRPATMILRPSIRLRLLKSAGRIVETASRLRVALASSRPEAGLFSLLAFQPQKSGP
jgi:hypothetical protein